MVITVDGRDIPLIAQRHARARRLRLRFDGASGVLRLTVPPRGSMTSARSWAAEQHDWIARQLASSISRECAIPGALLPFDGVLRRIDWQADAPRRPEVMTDHIVLGGPESGVGRRLARWLAEEARTEFTEATTRLCADAGLPLAGVSIGNPRSRWGSCSSTGQIRYSWRLMMAPAFVRQSVVAHEAAHLRHLDHSPRFHALAAELLGTDPAPARAWLKQNATQLHAWDFS
jgi:predicted metal-dependent hydrolase